MRKTLLTVLIVLLGVSAIHAQETYFGKNKVTYKDFDWKYIQTRHFDIYFYEDAYETAKFASVVLEEAYVQISDELDYLVQQRIPVFIYNSHNDFQQTNITQSLLGEGTGGFTELFKKRAVVPFNGSYEDFRHVLHHELTHAITFDMLYGSNLSSLIARQRFFSMPLWLAEGYAEYSSLHGWDAFSDMWMRDATINGYLVPLDYLTGYNAYRQGQALMNYIVEKYGEDKIGDLFKKGKVHLSMNKVLKKVLGVDEKELYEDFEKEMKRRYWPEIARREEADEIGQQLTKAREDGSYRNEKPVFSPEGDKLAIFTDKSDYTEIVLISADNGKTLRRLVESSRSGDLESLHSYVSGASFSPDGSQLVFVAKSDGKESLFFYDLEEDKIVNKVRLDYYNLRSPAWSPDGAKVAFSGLRGNRRDLFLYDLTSGAITQLTSDRYDDTDPSWYPGSGVLAFSSDRPHPHNEEYYSWPEPEGSTRARMPGDFEYGAYNLFKIDIASGAIEPLDFGPGACTRPAVSPDGSKIAFISDRNGIDNIYVGYVETGENFAVTDILTGVSFISWSPDGKTLAYEAFFRGAYDVFLLKDLVPAGDRGVLDGTDFATADRAWAPREAAPSVEETAADTLAAAPSSEPTDSLVAAFRDYVASKVRPALDSTTADTSLVDHGSEDTTPDSTLAGETPADTTDGESRIVDGEYVHIGQATDPLDTFMTEVPGDTTGSGQFPMTEPAAFDSIPPPDESGEYAVSDYRVKFTTDYIGGGFAYDTYFGWRGQTYFLFSDYLGNHQIVLVTSLVNTIDQSDFQGYYFNTCKRINFGAGFFHTKNYYLLDKGNHDILFSDRFYGLQAYASRPFSVFSRVELEAMQYFIDREYYDSWTSDSLFNRSSKVTVGQLSYVFDNIVWGITGPLNGRRAKVTLEAGSSFLDSQGGPEFWSLLADYRKYWHLGSGFSVAFRLAGGASFGSSPKRFFLGGATNWIGNKTVDAEVYDVENLYFADIVTPLRGYEYYEFSGDRYGLLNLEFRYPMIEYFAMRFPLPLVISRVKGAIFCDMGAAWEGDNFKGGISASGGKRLNDIKSGFGFGMRANLGFLILRYDLAWTTDFSDVADKPSYYFSVGTDF